jgi:hypothetical protein
LRVVTQIRRIVAACSANTEGRLPSGCFSEHALDSGIAVGMAGADREASNQNHYQLPGQTALR